ncbi:hypothetical protein Tco_0167799 [Tanacetum coccineum]
MASQDVRLSKFESNFKQQQGEMTNKIDTVLKAITDRITGALPSDTVKNLKLNVNSTSPVLSSRSYPTEDPQCSARIYISINAITIYPKQQSKPHNDKTGENEIAKMGPTDKDHHVMVRVECEHKESKGKEREEEGNTENINTDSPSQLDPSISFITKKVHKLNLFLETSGLVSQSSDIEFVCTKGWIKELGLQSNFKGQDKALVFSQPTSTTNTISLLIKRHEDRERGESRSS